MGSVSTPLPLPLPGVIGAQWGAELIFALGGNKSMQISAHFCQQGELSCPLTSAMRVGQCSTFTRVVRAGPSGELNVHTHQSSHYSSTRRLPAEMEGSIGSRVLWKGKKNIRMGKKRWKCQMSYAILRSILNHIWWLTAVQKQFIGGRTAFQQMVLE